MKADIHPEYKEVTYSCSGCNNTFTSRSTGQDLVVGVCSSCHPFFTGKHKLVDTAGRIERFKRKYGMASASTESAETPAPTATP